jgi:hypothetical protein
MQESSRLKEIPVVIMSSENVPTRINMLTSYMPKAQALKSYLLFCCLFVC